MARNRTAAVANQVAYDLGYRGIKVSQALLGSLVEDADRSEWQKRRAVLLARNIGANVHHTTLIVIGLIVFAIALFVDYAIIKEFWTRVLSNEFGEVPESMIDSVEAKSAQVLFATLAIHYLLTLKNRHAWVIRGIYSFAVFGIAFLMLLGIGIIWANASMPLNTKVFAEKETTAQRSLEQFSNNLGIPARQEIAPPQTIPAAVAIIRENETLIHLVSMGVIFIIVASIGAIALDSAVRAYSAWTGAAVYDRHEEAELGRHLTSQLACLAAEDQSVKCWFRKGWGASGEISETRDKSHRVNEFQASYTAGIVDNDKFSGERIQDLLSDLATAAVAVRQALVAGTPEQSRRPMRAI